MFDQMKNLKSLAGMMGQAGEMKEKMEQMQAALAEQTVEAQAGAGAVTVVMTGTFEVVDVKFDQPMLVALVGEGSDADRAMVSELLASAYNAAHEKAQGLAQQEMAKITGIDSSLLQGLKGLEP